MDGYSVTEAASVLGVPIERVWELLARGVLSGTPEGDTGMRVYLQPRPRPNAPTDDPRRPNGDRVAAEPEASPFRELLTEFRSLTERYGQALLALGEARGEVAALRTRVDLLEARMDLRLPMGAGLSTPWPAPPPVTHAAGPAETAEPAAEHAEEEHRARRRGPRRATESFAEALARAEDPSIPELPAAAAAREAPAAHHADAAGEPAFPRELPPADTMPVADEAGPVEEPMVVAEVVAEVETVAEALAPQEVADEPVAVEARPEPVLVEAAEPEPEPAEEPTAVAEPESVGEATTDPAPAAEEPEPEPLEEPMVESAALEVEGPKPEIQEAAPEPMEAEEPEPAAEESEPEPEEVAEAEPAGEEVEPLEVEPAAGAAEPALADFDTVRYTTAIEEPDWFEAEADDEPARTAAYGEPEPEPESEPAEAADAETEPEPEPRPTIADEAPAPDERTETRESSTTPAEETMLWFGRRPDDLSGADEMEVAGSGGAAPEAATDSSPPRPLPGSEELDEAMVALEDLTRRTEVRQPAEHDEWPPASSGLAEPAGGASTSQPRTSPVTRLPYAPGGRPGSPATRAYRRLRRIFPG